MSTPSLCQSGRGRPLGCGWDAACVSAPSAPCCRPADPREPFAAAAVAWSKGLAASAAAAAILVPVSGGQAQAPSGGEALAD